MVDSIQSEKLSTFPELSHGFFTRNGGVSQGDFFSLNTVMEKGDPAENVLENRSRICRSLGVSLDSLATVNQVHSSTVLTITKPFPLGRIPEADAMVTKIPGIALGVFTADCVPVLFFDPQARVIGAAHSGWKGAVSGIIQNTVQAMCDLGATKNHIIAAIGPCIWQGSYEVSEDFQNHHPDILSFLTGGKRPGHLQFNLPGFVEKRLLDAGITSISPSSFDTFSNPDLFFSFRRKTLNNEANFGCSLSAIVLRRFHE
jgi:YfiH family protein